MRTTLTAAKAFGLRRVELTVRRDNANAIALYEKVGFEVEGYQRGAVQVDGVFHDVVMMSVLF